MLYCLIFILFVAWSVLATKESMTKEALSFLPYLNLKKVTFIDIH